MATIKYTDKEGKTHYINQYKVNNVFVQQELGESTTDVVSQKVVTDELNKTLKFTDYSDEYITIAPQEKGFVLDCGEY